MSERDLHDDVEDTETTEAGPAEWDIEAPEADAAEQRTAVRETPPGRYGPLGLDADEADSADQQVEVELDEDDYR